MKISSSTIMQLLLVTQAATEAANLRKTQEAANSVYTMAYTNNAQGYWYDLIDQSITGTAYCSDAIANPMNCTQMLGYGDSQYITLSGSASNYLTYKVCTTDNQEICESQSPWSSATIGVPSEQVSCSTDLICTEKSINTYSFNVSVYYPTQSPTYSPTVPTSIPSGSPTSQPTNNPTQPTGLPTSMPTNPSSQPTTQPTGIPSIQPTSQPTVEPPPAKQPPLTTEGIIGVTVSLAAVLAITGYSAYSYRKDPERFKENFQRVYDAAKVCPSKLFACARGGVSSVTELANFAKGREGREHSVSNPMGFGFDEFSTKYTLQ